VQFLWLRSRWAQLPRIYEYWSRLWGAAIGMVTGEAKGRHLAISLIIASIPIILVGLTLGKPSKIYYLMILPLPWD
jgi:undecaprenyl pyrophosphate phosphatase UppP